MKKLAFTAVLPLLVAACGNLSADFPEAWKQQKASCAAGSYEACATLGHEVRAAEGGPATVQYPPFSQPIID